MIKIFAAFIGTFLLFAGMNYMNFFDDSPYHLQRAAKAPESGNCVETVAISVGNALDCPEDTNAQLVATVARSPECLSTFMYFFNWKKDGVDVRNFLADFGIVSDDLSSLEPGNDPLSPGMYTISVSDFENGGPQFSNMFTLEVEDTTPPLINCTSNSVVSTDSGLCSAVVTFPVPTATDDCDFTISQTGGPTSGSTFPLGDSIITYTATDSSGNSSSCSFTITVEDQEPPELTCISEKIVKVFVGAFYEIPNYIAEGAYFQVTDNCTDPVITGSQDPAPGTQLGDGQYTVTLTLEDEAGNSTSCEFELFVHIFLSFEDEAFQTSVTVINPVDGELFITNNSSVSLEKYGLFDTTGKPILKGEFDPSTQQIGTDVSNLASGIYFLLLEAGPYQTIKKIIIN